MQDQTMSRVNEMISALFDWLRAFLGAIWVFLGGLTAAQVNVYLGTVSLVLGISYQVWRWRKEKKESEAKQ